MKTSKELHTYNALQSVPSALLHKAKRQGISDFQIARAIGEYDVEQGALKVRAHRKALGILPVV